MLKKQYRLTSSAQIKELKQRGRSWHNRWLVLVKRASDRPESRFAFSVSRRLGNAVVRNRTRRAIRECIRRRLPSIAKGWDVLLIARSPAKEASFAQIDQAVADLIHRSRLQTLENDSVQPPTPLSALSTSPAPMEITPYENNRSVVDPALPKDTV
jgi:ribonuclease P protein component